MFFEEKDSYSIVMDFSRFVSPKAGYDPDGWKSQLYPNEIARNSWRSSRCSCNKSKRLSDVGCWMNHPSPNEVDFVVFGPSSTLQLLVWLSLGGKQNVYPWHAETMKRNMLLEASDYAFIPFGAGSGDLSYPTHRGDKSVGDSSAMGVENIYCSSSPTLGAAPSPTYSGT